MEKSKEIGKGIMKVISRFIVGVLLVASCGIFAINFAGIPVDTVISVFAKEDRSITPHSTTVSDMQWQPYYEAQAKKNQKKPKDTEKEKKKKREAFFKDAVFIGDSITEGVSFYGYIPTKRVFAKKGCTAKAAAKYLPDIAKIKPKKVYILLGSNDLNYNNKSIDKIIEEYDALLTEAKKKLPDATIYVQSVFPVTQKYEQKNKKITNKRINALNKKLIALAKEHDVTYINVAKSLKDKNGRLPSKWSSDGLHLKDQYYAKWFDALMKVK